MKKKKIFFIASLFICIFFAWILYNLFREWKCCDFSREFKKGNEIIQKIEAYKKRMGKLPEVLEDIGEETTSNGPIFYNKIDSNKYIVSFGVELGSSCIYRSETKKWTPTPVG